MAGVEIISFFVEEFGSGVPSVYAFVPAISGTRLTAVVRAFEENRSYAPLGGYGGLIPQHFNYEPLDRYLLGHFEPGSYWLELGGAYVLGCDCGEAGCWPLICRIRQEGDAVIWDRFSHPQRPERDYSQLGPFVFDAAQYQRAVKDLQAELAARSHS